MKREDHIADFETLFGQTWNKVYLLCLRYCRHEDVAKDLTQNIYASLWQREVRFDDMASAEKYQAKAAPVWATAFFQKGNTLLPAKTCRRKK